VKIVSVRQVPNSINSKTHDAFAIQAQLFGIVEHSRRKIKMLNQEIFIRHCLGVLLHTGLPSDWGSGRHGPL
jgi:hypothetical protein